jgi:hypothetical protein
MPPKTAPLPRPAPDVLPREDKPEIMPDDLRRRDQPETPDSLPPIDENISVEGRPSEDGENPDHPIHDEDQEDLEPQDYEEEIDEAERETLAEHPEGSAPPLDRLTQERGPDSQRN